MRILHFVISARATHYDKMRDSLSRLYKTNDKIDTYFLELSDTINCFHSIIDDRITFRGSESFVPGILKKTVDALVLFEDTLENYDFIIRSNLSTVINFRRLTTFLTDSRVTANTYFGANFLNLNGINPPFGIIDQRWQGLAYAEGTLIGLGKELAGNILRLRHRLDFSLIDDVALAVLIQTENLHRIPLRIPSNQLIGWSGYHQELSAEAIIKNASVIAWRNKTADRQVDAARVELISRTMILANNAHKHIKITKEITHGEYETETNCTNPIESRKLSAGDKTITKETPVRVLYIDPNIPSLNTDAGSEASFHYIYYLRMLGFSVDYLPLMFRPRFLEYAQSLAATGTKILDTREMPRESIFNWVAREAANYRFIIASRPDVGLEFVRRKHLFGKLASKPFLIYNIVDFHYERMEREATLTSNTNTKLAASEMKRVEVAILEYFDAAIFLNSREVDKAMHLGFTGSQFMWGHVVDIQGVPSFQQNRKAIVFVGSGAHQPNYDGIRWFLEEIWSEVTDKFPGLSLHIVGEGFERLLGNQDLSRVCLHGFVQDLGPIFDQAICSIAPLRYGAGLKGKIVTSLSYGVPVICTSIAAEGFSTENITQVLHCLDEFNSLNFALALNNIINSVDNDGSVSKQCLQHCSASYDSRSLAWRIADSISRHIPNASTQSVREVIRVIDQNSDSRAKFNSVLKIAMSINFDLGLKAATDFVDTWTPFCNDSSVHGIRYSHNSRERLIPSLSPTIHVI